MIRVNTIDWVEKAGRKSENEMMVAPMKVERRKTLVISLS